MTTRPRCEQNVWRWGTVVPCGRPDTHIWRDETGREHAGCGVHRAELEHRWPPARVGRLVLTTPWAQQYLPEADRPAVEAAIPEGTRLHVGATSRPGHAWVLQLVGDAGLLWRSEVRADPQRYPLAWVCLAELARHEGVAA